MAFPYGCTSRKGSRPSFRHVPRKRHNGAEQETAGRQNFHVDTSGTHFEGLDGHALAASGTW
jgi:hypothetical protein